ncbi:glycosyltransferase family 4 protein [Leyella stercorea]|uniref:glycosyltransferase family 4 protein n=1 Tax=Leyella stercorea TaxID=363265 RepID=UPI001A5BE6F5|nr:glycosyltransferase family 4 protein [Leyella stercorea]MBL6516181.1 glycosyltransferase family 4 protein [Leyella stercorea]
MRTFHLITHFSLGGAERVAANIAESQTHGMEYHVVEIMRGRTAYTPKFIAELEQAGVRCHRSWMPDVSFHFLFERIAALLFPLRMLYIMLRWRPDVIHTHTETPDLALYVFSRLFPFMLRRVKIVRTIHNTRLWTGLPRTAQWVETFFKSNNANIAISDSVRDSYAERFGEVPPIINNGVAEVEQKDYFNTSTPQGVHLSQVHQQHLNTSTFNTQHSTNLNTSTPPLGFCRLPEQEHLNILFAGRLEPQKGVVVLCEVLKMLAGDARYFFTIAGDGSQRTLVEQTLADIVSSGKPLNAQLVPPIFGLAGYMQSFDYLFMPSEFEGLSMLSMEASLNRLPVIANACPGLADTLPADWALLAHNNSLNDYRRIFNELLPTADHDALTQRAYDFAKDRFSVRTMQERYEARYKATGRSAEKAGR